MHMQCRFLYMVAIVLLGNPVGTEYIHVWWSISRTLQYLSPLSPFHLLSWLFFHIRLKQMCRVASLWLYEQTSDISKERKLHDFLSPVSFHGSLYRRHRKMSKHLVSVLNFFFLKKKGNKSTKNKISAKRRLDRAFSLNMWLLLMKFIAKSLGP